MLIISLNINRLSKFFHC